MWRRIIKEVVGASPRHFTKAAQKKKMTSTSKMIMRTRRARSILILMGQEVLADQLTNFTIRLRLLWQQLRAKIEPNNLPEWKWWIHWIKTRIRGIFSRLAEPILTTNLPTLSILNLATACKISKLIIHRWKGLQACHIWNSLMSDKVCRRPCIIVGVISPKSQKLRVNSAPLIVEAPQKERATIRTIDREAYQKTSGWRNCRTLNAFGFFTALLRERRSGNNIPKIWKPSGFQNSRQDWCQRNIFDKCGYAWTFM